MQAKKAREHKMFPQVPTVLNVSGLNHMSDFQTLGDKLQRGEKKRRKEPILIISRPLM